jgi:CRISPR system Cascade subunit CasA
MNEHEPAASRLSPDAPLDLLDDPVFTVVPAEGPRLLVSLAELLARLGRGTPSELAYLMPHQQHVMHAFAVQLAALVCARSGAPHLDRDAAQWRADLRALGGCAEAFQLVVNDLRKPAFLQPPVPEGTLDGFQTVETPDELDVLVLAKNHDVKAARLHRPRVEQWIFALLSLQTQQGFSGRANYGIARMNSGFGNRPGLGAAPSLDWAQRFARDVGVALRARGDLLTADYPFVDQGLALLWLEPWDGTRSLSPSQLDPFFIEIARRIRFTTDAGRLTVRRTSTEAPRVDAKSMNGNTGDLWTPIERERGVGLTLPADGFSYVRVSNLLFEDDWRRPPALELAPEDGPAPRVLARAMVRGQGKTEGLHERDIPLSPRAVRRLQSREGRTELGALAKERIEAASNLRLRALKPALCAYLQGGADDLRLDDDRAAVWLAAFERGVDAEFFARLFEDLDDEPEARAIRFEQWLVGLARELLSRAMDALPTPTARRERAIAAAEARLSGGIRKLFPRTVAHREPLLAPENERT